MRTMAILEAVVLVGLPMFAQQEREKGAKAIFLDTQSGRMTMPTVPRPALKRDTGSRSSVEVPAITGLMYYLELLQPGGELVRVTSNRVFHTGDRVRIHVTSNVDGRLTILQSQDSGKFEELFPSPKLSESASVVRKGVDTVLPAPGGWFKFDERPGEIRLLMMLTAEPVSAAPTAGQRPAENRLGGTVPSVDERLKSMLQCEELQRGSKALIIETGDSPRDAFEVRVVNSEKDRKLPPGQIVVQLRLQHRPKP